VIWTSEEALGAFFAEHQEFFQLSAPETQTKPPRTLVADANNPNELHELAPEAEGGDPAEILKEIAANLVSASRFPHHARALRLMRLYAEAGDGERSHKRAMAARTRGVSAECEANVLRRATERYLRKDEAWADADTLGFLAEAGRNGLLGWGAGAKTTEEARPATPETDAGEEKTKQSTGERMHRLLTEIGGGAAANDDPASAPSPPDAQNTAALSDFRQLVVDAAKERGKHPKQVALASLDFCTKLAPDAGGLPDSENFHRREAFLALTGEGEACGTKIPGAGGCGMTPVAFLLVHQHMVSAYFSAFDLLRQQKIDLDRDAD
jgi:hypothetical protein